MLACLVGCDRFKPRSTPPGPTTVTSTGFDGTYRFLFWNGGPTILICAGFRGSDSSQSTGSTEDPVCRTTGSMTAYDGRKFEWHAENTKSLDVKFTLAGKEYDLTKGTVFLVTSAGGEMKVQQLQRDLSAVQPTAESCKAFIKQDPDLSKVIKPIP